MMLKPCPFCGGEAAFGTADNSAFVNCTVCLASTNVLVPVDYSKEDAIMAWNLRTSPSIPGERRFPGFRC